MNSRDDEPHGPSFADRGEPDASGAHVEIRPGWLATIPVGAIIIIVSVALATSIGGGPTDEALGSTLAPTSTTERTTTLPPSTTTSPSVTSSVERTTTTIQTRIDIPTRTVGGNVYLLDRQRHLMNIDLSTGAIERVAIDEAWQVQAIGDVVLAVGDGVTVFDRDLTFIANITGSLVAAQPGEIWTAKNDGSGSTTQLNRYDSDGNHELTIESSLPFVDGRYVGGALQITSTGGQWRIGEDGEVTPVPPGEPTFSPFQFRGNVASVCSEDELTCTAVVFRDGEAVVVSGADLDLWSIRQSPSGRFLLTQGPNGFDLVDIDKQDGRVEFQIRPDDRWAANADLVVSISGRILTLVDPLSAEEWSYEMPTDARLREFPPAVSIDVN
jgi:hypothetical protein